MATETATFAMGCFWGPDALFAKVPGVMSTRVGYSGGTKEDPTYEEVCTERTGHAEAVEIVFDPKLVSYAHLLDLFWHHHNPTTQDHQGPDYGAQYRSSIFYHSPAQQKLAEQTKHEIQKLLKQPVVTEIVPATRFWSAEEYHQHYFAKKGITRSCHISWKTTAELQSHE
ncbi:peptide-methionine (S)-S-oxide reductase MsrA [Candidatus Pacearchaeota archaeon]|nr:peptide-methionine (S)-S-oxide reductase MsrA [Candidatus Pacearchaeota archaeon]